MIITIITITAYCFCAACAAAKVTLARGASNIRSQSQELQQRSHCGRWVLRRARCPCSYRRELVIQTAGSLADRRSDMSCRRSRPYKQYRCLAPRLVLHLARRTASNARPTVTVDSARDLHTLRHVVNSNAFNLNLNLTTSVIHREQNEF